MRRASEQRGLTELEMTSVRVEECADLDGCGAGSGGDLLRWLTKVKVIEGQTAKAADEARSHLLRQTHDQVRDS